MSVYKQHQTSDSFWKRLAKRKLPAVIQRSGIYVGVALLLVSGFIWGYGAVKSISIITTVGPIVAAVVALLLAYLALPFLYDRVTTAKTDSDPRNDDHTPDDFDSIPFHFNERLSNPGEYFGRAMERATLIHRARNGNSTSIVGPRRIGKTWLMTYLKLVAPLQLDASFHVGYVDASLPTCKTMAGFTAKALQALNVPVVTANVSALGLKELEAAVESSHANNQMPILCIDEFESLVGGQDFDADFFTGLRAITQTGLTLVTASKSPLIDIVSEQVKTSPFFNIFEQLTLKPFNAQDAENFATSKGKQAGFTDQECRYLLEYAQDELQWPPLRLQLVGKLLAEDKIAAKKDATHYQPERQGYWRDFQKRIDEAYQAAVKAGSK